MSVEVAAFFVSSSYTRLAFPIMSSLLLFFTFLIPPLLIITIILIILIIILKVNLSNVSPAALASAAACLHTIVLHRWEKVNKSSKFNSCFYPARSWHQPKSTSCCDVLENRWRDTV